MLKECEIRAHIPAITAANGKITINPQSINTTFSSFFENLYKSDINFKYTTCNSFLENLDLPHIPQADQDELEAPLTLDELHRALKDLNKSKSSGLDGLPPELFLELWDTIGSLMLSLILQSGTGLSIETRKQHLLPFS